MESGRTWNDNAGIAGGLVYWKTPIVMPIG